MKKGVVQRAVERLKAKYGFRTIFITQPADDTPAGEFMLDVLAASASFQTAQQSKDVREGLDRRVKGGLFVGLAPFGYRNIRVNGRGLIEIDPVDCLKVGRIYFLYAHCGRTLESLAQALADEGIVYCKSRPSFSVAQLHAILRSRAYIGEVNYHGRWLPGKHEPLVDRETWNRVQYLLGASVYRAHELTYAGEMIRCGHCNGAITGEMITKKSGTTYTYYRCSRYNTDGHPRVRLTENQLDQQVLGLFEKMRIEEQEVRDWFAAVLRARSRAVQTETNARRDQLQRQLSLVAGQRDQLLNMRLLGEIDADTFAGKDTELRDREAEIKLQLDVASRGRDEHADLAIKTFELSQSLRDKWLTANYAAKRQVLEILCLNSRLESTTLVPTMRRPFEILSEGPLTKTSRGDWI